jgi:hypothetical protein
LKTPSLRPNVQIDAWIVMPDHVHFILNIRSRANRQAGVGAWRAMPLPATDVRIVLRVVQTRIDRNQYVNVHEPAG